jgi:Fe-Mn family superoxide dismutase
MTPEKAAPAGAIGQAINQAFGSLDAFKKAFVEEGVGHFGSGWVWLVTGSEGLKVISTHDAEDTLVREGLFPLITCDLWEHAYYLDFQNDRPGFLNRWFDETANWDFAESQLAASNGQGQGFRYPAPTAGQTSPAAGEQRPRM